MRGLGIEISQNFEGNMRSGFSERQATGASSDAGMNSVGIEMRGGSRSNFSGAQHALISAGNGRSGDFSASW